MAQHRAQHVAPRHVRRLRQLVRVPRRLRPVLAALVEPVRRGAHRRVGGHPLGEIAGVGTSRVHADGEVGHDADAHAGIGRGALGVAELFVEDPLQPAVEVDEFLPQLLDVLVRAQRSDQAGELPVVAGGGAHLDVAVGAPARVVEDAAALLVQEPLVIGAADLRQGDVVNGVQGTQFRGVDRVAVDLVGGTVELAEARGQFAQLGGVRFVEVGEFRDHLHPDVQRVGVPAGRGQVRRILHRRARLGGVQRVDQHEVRPRLARGHAGQVAQGGQIADSPGPLGAHRVQLCHHAGRGLVDERVGRRQASRSHGQLAFGRVLAVDGAQRVPAQGQVLRHGEGGLAQQDAVDPAGADVVLDLGQRPLGAVVEDGRDGNVGAVGDVDQDFLVGAAGAHDHRRQEFAPAGIGPRIACGDDVLVRRIRGVVPEIDVEGGEDLQDRLPGHGGLFAVVRGEARGDAEIGGEVGQRGGHGKLRVVVGHATHHASHPMRAPVRAERIFH